jgi:hypothetical protein
MANRYFLSAGAPRTKLEFHHPKVNNLPASAGQGSFTRYQGNPELLRDLEEMDFEEYKAKHSSEFGLNEETPAGNVTETKDLLCVLDSNKCCPLD